jgi:hypothetical protein
MSPFRKSQILIPSVTIIPSSRRVWDRAGIIACSSCSRMSLIIVKSGIRRCKTFASIWFRTFCFILATIFHFLRWKSPRKADASCMRHALTLWRQFKIFCSLKITSWSMSRLWKSFSVTTSSIKNWSWTCIPFWSLSFDIFQKKLRIIRA